MGAGNVNNSNLRGFADNVFGNIIAGWAVNGDQPVAIDLYVDGTFVSQTPSVRFREDLKGSVSPHGFCGFNVLVPAIYCDGIERPVRLTFADSDQALGHGELVFSHSLEYRSPEIVIFAEPRYGDTARTLLSLLAPMDVVGGSLIRVGGVNDGGYLMLDHHLDNAICYSFGINDDVAWDSEMADRGGSIYQYDHTIELLPHANPAFNWHKVGIAARSTEDGSFTSIPDIISDLGHSGQSNLILKCDIEGHEWTALDVTPTEILSQFSQILIEIHGLSRLDDHEHVARVIRVLEKLNATHQVAHLHANNCGWYVMAGGVGMPDTFEMSYVRRSDHDFVPTHRIYPRDLDRPCSDSAADYYLGPIGCPSVSTGR